MRKELTEEEIANDFEESFYWKIKQQAEKGGDEGIAAGYELVSAAFKDLEEVDTPAINWLSEKLLQIASGVNADRALCIKREENKGGRPKNPDQEKYIAIDLLLRNYAKLSPSLAAKEIQTRFELDPRTLRDYRKKYCIQTGDTSRTGMEHLSVVLLTQAPKEILVQYAGDYYTKIADLFEKSS